MQFQLNCLEQQLTRIGRKLQKKKVQKSAEKGGLGVDLSTLEIAVREQGFGEGEKVLQEL